MQVVVIGGGVIGLWSARSLLQAGLSVIVLDESSGHAIATPASAGWVVPALSLPLSGPGVVRHTIGQVLRRQAAFSVTPSRSIGPWLWRFLRSGRKAEFDRGLAATLDLAAGAVRGFADLQASGVDLEQHHDGLIVVARSNHGRRDAVAIAETAEAAGYPGKYDLLDSEELLHREPSLDRGVEAGVHLLDEVHIRPEQLVDALRSEVLRLGGEIRTARARRLVPAAGGWNVTVGGDELRADRVVVAAGYWSRELLADLGTRIPLEAAAGFSVTATGTNPPRHPLKLVEADVAVTPFDEGVRLAGRFALGSTPSVPSAPQLRRVVEAATRYLHEWRPERVVVEQVGLRPVTPDSLPLIGQPRAHPGLVLATGHGMLGLTLAPGTAAEVAHQVVTGTPTTAGLAFSPDRFA